METKNKKVPNRRWTFTYVFLFSFLWKYSLVGIFQIHPLQDQFHLDSPFDEVFISSIALASFILASVCIVLCFLVGIINNKRKGRGITFDLWVIGFVMLHGGILPLLPTCFIWQTWPFDAYMIRQFYLAWAPAAVIGPAMWWFLPRLLEGKFTVEGQGDLIDEDLVRKNRQP